MDSDVRIRAAQYSDLGSVQTLFQEESPVFDRGKLEELWRWWSKGDPLGEPFGWLAFRQSDSRPLGFCGAYASETFLEGRTVRSATLHDAIVRPEARGQGIFTTLCKHGEGWLQHRGFEVIWGFPNKRALGSHIRAGAEGTYAWKSLFPLIPAMGGSRSLRVAKLDGVPSNATSLWQSMRARYSISLERSAEFMRWRFELRPDSEYEFWGFSDTRGRDAADSPWGYAVTRTGRWHGWRVAWVMDMIVESGRPWQRAHSALLSMLRGKGCRFVLHLAARTDLRDAGMPIRHLPLVVYHGAYRLPRSRDSWNLSWTDVDYL